MKIKHTNLEIRLFLVLLIILCFFLNVTSVQAEEHNNEASSSVEISITFTEENRYDFIIDVGEGGAVIDGSQAIRNGIVNYELPLDTQKQLLIVADKGYRIATVQYERPEFSEVRDLISNIKNGTLKFDIESTECILRVRFEKDETVNEDVLDKPSNSDQVQTGDRRTRSYFISAALCSLALMILIKRNQKEDI